MAAFEKGSGGMGGGAPDMDDILAQMFGFGMGGGMPRGAGPGARRGRGRGEDEDQEYQVTLEELYKGKTTRFASTKNVICSQCSGSGGKEKAKPNTCDTCKGKGMYQKLQSVGPGMVAPMTVPCATCHGRGEFYREKDKCKKCKGERTVKQKKMLELYIPPGSREGEKIVLQGEADQVPDQEPGDIVFHLTEVPHRTFRRAGGDLAADLDITLAEALTGFDRVILTHLDGRGIRLSVTTPTDLPLQPGQCLKVPGEGMPLKRSDQKGDLYLIVQIEFPKKGWLSSELGEPQKKLLLDALPKPAPPIIVVGEVDDVDVEYGASMENFGAGSGDPRAGEEWEDEDDEGAGGAQCAQQ